MDRQGHSPVAADARDHDLENLWAQVVGRRSFLKGVGLATAASLPAAAAVGSDVALAASSAPTKGDIAILRFLAAAEIIESDLWSQYAELGGANGGNSAYMAALSNLDADMPQYISDNTDDELSHAAFINAYLVSKGAKPVSLERFRTLAGSHATGSSGKKRLTNLKNLTVDTSFYTRYRAGRNPDLGATFPQAINIRNQPAIPLTDADTPPNQQQPIPPKNSKQSRMQAIANAASFHFAFIEQGGSSLYTAMSLKASSLEVLRIVVSIGGVETNHFSLWHDKLGNAVAQPVAGVTDPETGTTFPDLNARNSELAQTNLILPEPSQFLSPGLPACSVVRPSSDHKAGARAAIAGFTADGLFDGQSPAFFNYVKQLANAADAAQRHVR